MKVTDEEMQVALPILMRAQREEPSRWLEPLLARMVGEAHRRELIALLRVLELEAAAAGTVQSEGPAVAGPSVTEREAED